jgi:hypothetical protein
MSTSPVPKPDQHVELTRREGGAIGRLDFDIEHPDVWPVTSAPMDARDPRHHRIVNSHRFIHGVRYRRHGHRGSAAVLLAGVRSALA